MKKGIAFIIGLSAMFAVSAFADHPSKDEILKAARPGWEGRVAFKDGQWKGGTHTYNLMIQGASDTSEKYVVSLYAYNERRGTDVASTFNHSGNDPSQELGVAVRDSYGGFWIFRFYSLDKVGYQYWPDEEARTKEGKAALTTGTFKRSN